jgi:hypothetical protein
VNTFFGQNIRIGRDVAILMHFVESLRSVNGVSNLTLSLLRTNDRVVLFLKPEQDVSDKMFAANPNAKAKVLTHSGKLSKIS